MRGFGREPGRTTSKRVETPEYRRVHRELIVEKDLPCMVCGVRQSTLGVPAENPYGAKQMETHHCIIEWALAEAIDVDKFNRTILPHLAERQPGNAEYRTAFDRKRLRAWVDHSVDNLWVLVMCIPTWALWRTCSSA